MDSLIIKDIISRTTQGILGGIHINIFQDILDNTFIFQDVDQDVLREFQRSPFIKGMARNWLNHASACVTGYHLGGQFI